MKILRLLTVLFLVALPAAAQSGTTVSGDVISFGCEAY